MKAIARGSLMCGLVIGGTVWLTGCQSNTTSTRPANARATNGMTDTDASPARTKQPGQPADTKQVNPLLHQAGVHHSTGVSDSDVAE